MYEEYKVNRDTLYIIAQANSNFYCLPAQLRGAGTLLQIDKTAM